MTCAPSEHSDQPGHMPSLISLRCLHEETTGPRLLIECTMKTPIRLSSWPMHRLIRRFAECICDFVVLRLGIHRLKQILCVFAQLGLNKPLGQKKKCCVYCNISGKKMAWLVGIFFFIYKGKGKLKLLITCENIVLSAL